MPTPAYDLGKTQHAEGKTLEENPYAIDTDAVNNEDWANGWQDSASEVRVSEDAAAEAVAKAEEEAAAIAKSEEESETTTSTEVVNALGDVGYSRILELLENPPIGDSGDGGLGLPPDGEVPEDLDEWLKAWKQPLAFVAVDTAISVVTSRISGTTKGQLKELYRGMGPMEVAAAMEANAETISGFADERVAEAGLMSSIQSMVTQKAASYLLSALLLI